MIEVSLMRSSRVVLDQRGDPPLLKRVVVATTRLHWSDGLSPASFGRLEYRPLPCDALDVSCGCSDLPGGSLDVDHFAAGHFTCAVKRYPFLHRENRRF